MCFCLTRPRFGQKKKLGTEEGPKVRILFSLACFIISPIACFIFPRMLSVNE